MPIGRLRRTALSCGASLGLLVQIGCGSSSDPCAIDPGEPGSGPQSGRTLFVVTPNADIDGDEDNDLFYAYHIAENGSLLDPPEERPARNPRRLLVHGQMLYVAESDRVSAYHLTDDGMPEAAPSSQTSAGARPDDPEGVEPLESDPIDFTVAGEVLYVVERGRGQIAAYRLDQGELPPFPSTEGREPLSFAYRGVALIGAKLYASDWGGVRLDTFSLDEAGDFIEDDPETEDEVETVAQPDASIDAEGRPAALFAEGGILYVVEQENTLRIVTYTPDADGQLPEDGPTSATGDRAFYEHVAVAGDLIYAPAFDLGEVDVYEIAADGSLPADPLASTEGCPVASSNGVAVLSEAQVLYVSQSELDRVDVFRLDAGGTPEATPSFSVELPADSFPTDVGVFAPSG